MSHEVLRLHEFVPRSRANGPGQRCVVWVQGCTLSCPDCYNPASHDARAGTARPVAEIADLILSLNGIDGVTYSGGEPLQQLSALSTLTAWIRRRSTLSQIVFTGFSRSEIDRIPDAKTLLFNIDAVIAGRYVRELHHGRGLLGSTNQEIILLTQRHSMDDFLTVPTSEVIIEGDGSVVSTGVDPVTIRGR